LAVEMTVYKQVRATEAGVEVRAVVLLDGQLYVARKHSSKIDVLHPVTLTRARSIAVAELTDPGSMAGCPAQKSLFITCFAKKEVLKIRVAGALLTLC